ncbi:putative protein kinase [Septoria linicola]|nr:putative protein kinase [Septoria linicola]
MDYETADGSQFSLREIWNEDGGTPDFECTLITAFVDGNAYAGRAERRIEEMDDVDVIQYLEPVPEENIFPVMSKDFTPAPAFHMSDHYLKAPQFTYEDSRPGKTFVADCMYTEAFVLEHLKKHPHPSIVEYYGCVLKGNRITHLCLKRCYCNLAEYAEVGLSEEEQARLLEQVQDGLKHLHSLGLAHNDINPGNICVDSTGNAMIVDFDSCAPLGKTLRKGVGYATNKGRPVSDKKNDYQGFKEIVEFLKKDRKRSSACYPQD